MSLITITGGLGCGVSGAAKIVADELGVDLYDDQRLQEEAFKIGIVHDEVKGVEEKAPGLFDRLFNRRSQAYLNLMEALIYEVARRGEGVILGHVAQWLIRDFGCALHIRIYASESNRIKYLVEQLGVEDEVAQKMIRKSDSERSGFMQFAYHIDWNDPSLYDLIINQDKLGDKGTSKIIADAARSQEILACSLTAMDAMDRLSLLKRVEASIIKNRISTLELNIDVPEKGVVYLTGTINPFESEANVVEIVKGVPGVLEVRSHVTVPPIHEVG
ncbi:MAG: cytidylate kinase family protein [Deltaproteobacteria bacterium]|nr:cytidylate kinase family protein [Deltaproteobacteria bacterium]